MVLSDITNDYTTFIQLLDKYNSENSYINSALDMINQYHDKINLLADRFLKSKKIDSDRTNLISGLNSIETAFANQLANMNTSMRNTTRLITEIERLEFVSSSVKEEANSLCSSLNNLMDLTEEYAANRIKNISNTTTFFKLIDELDIFKNVHIQIYSNYDILTNSENELLEKLPFDDNEISFYTLDIRSSKPELNISSFSDDLNLLASCLQNLERLIDSSCTQSIYLRKIESGSLKAIFGSDKVDFSIFPDLITSISNAIKTWRTTPAEITKANAETEKIKAETEKIKAETSLLQAQAEATFITNEGSKLAIANSQIDLLCDKLNLDPNNPEQKEQIQHFCLPLINYLEKNPIGTVNGIKYDISKEVHLIENPISYN